MMRGGRRDLGHHGAMSVRYDDVIDSLRAAYDGGAAPREGSGKSPWKLAEREAFLGRLKEHGVGDRGLPRKALRDHEPLDVPTVAANRSLGWVLSTTVVQHA